MGWTHAAVKTDAVDNGRFFCGFNQILHTDAGFGEPKGIDGKAGHDKGVPADRLDPLRHRQNSSEI